MVEFLLMILIVFHDLLLEPADETRYIEFIYISNRKYL